MDYEDAIECLQKLYNNTTLPEIIKFMKSNRISYTENRKRIPKNRCIERIIRYLKNQEVDKLEDNKVNIKNILQCSCKKVQNTPDKCMYEYGPIFLKH